MNSMNVSTLNQTRNQNGTVNWTQLLASFKRACGIKTRGGISQESKSVEERALLNPLILQKILGYLDDAGDLLNCRLVCFYWNFLATEILVDRRSLTINFHYDEKSGAYFKSIEKCSFYRNKDSSPWLYKTRRGKMPLKNLVRVIKSAGAGIFPCVSFEITAGDLEAEDISEFLQLYGENVQKLGLDFEPYCEESSGNSSVPQRSFPKVSLVRNLLCCQLPNLKILEMFRMKSDFSLAHENYFDFHHLFQEFELEPTETGISTAAAFSPEQEPGKIKQDPENETIMIAQLPKLEKLNLKISSYHNFHCYYDYSDNSDRENPGKNVILKNIKESKSVEFCGLSRRNWRCRDCVNTLISKNREEKLLNLELSRLGLDLMEKILEKCSTQLRFSQLDIDIGIGRETARPSMKTRTIRVLNSLFSIVANSSEKGTFVRIKRPIGFLSDADFEIPAMRNVSHLVLKNPQNHNEFPFFPCGFTLSDSFPNLRSVSLFNWAGEFPSDLWGQNCQVLPTVQEFNLSTNYHSLNPQDFPTSSPRAFANLAQIFPNLKKLQLHSINNFPAAAPFLWKLKELKKLTIGLFVGIGSSAPGNSNSNWNELSAIDSAITGLTMETCQQLAAEESKEFLKRAKKAAKAMKTNDEGKSAKSFGFLDRSASRLESTHFESLRVNPSICHLPKLKKLTIQFIDEDLSRKESYFLISELSGFFAFRLMPQLQVCLIPEAKNSENLQKMANHLRKMKPFLEILLRDAKAEEESDADN